MIKSSFPGGANQTKPFPKIMRNKESGSLVLFPDASKGTVLHIGQTAHAIGSRIDTLSPEKYEDYNCPVTLENA